MKLRTELLAFWLFFVLSLTSFCHGKNMVKVNVIGQIHCKDCTNLTYLGINIIIHCKSRKQETNTTKNGHVDKEGKFSIKLTADFKKDEYDPIDSCFAELQSQNQPTSSCSLPSAQTASVKIVNTNKSVILKFSPITCQFKNIHTSTPPRGPPIKRAPPPLLVALSPEYPIPPTPSPRFQSPRNRPTSEGPTPAPTSKSPNPTSKSSYSPSPSPIYITPPPKAFHQTPSVPDPVPPITSQTPITAPPITMVKPPKAFATSPTSESPYSPSPSPIYITPPPFSKQIPTPPPKAFHQTPSLPAPISPITSQTPIIALPMPMAKPPTPFSTSPSPSPSPNPYPPLNRRKPNPIPRAPPVPQLPPIPPVSRKYFNSPISQPPSSS